MWFHSWRECRFLLTSAAKKNSVAPFCVGIALDLVLYLKTQFNTRNKTRGFNLGFIPQVSNQVYNPGIIGYYTCRQVQNRVLFPRHNTPRSKWAISTSNLTASCCLIVKGSRGVGERPFVVVGFRSPSVLVRRGRHLTGALQMPTPPSTAAPPPSPPPVAVLVSAIHPAECCRLILSRCCVCVCACTCGCPCVLVPLCPCVLVSLCHCVRLAMCLYGHVSMCPCVRVSLCP